MNEIQAQDARMSASPTINEKGDFPKNSESLPDKECTSVQNDNAMVSWSAEEESAIVWKYVCVFISKTFPAKSFLMY